jgi:hypothetical protein
MLLMRTRNSGLLLNGQKLAIFYKWQAKTQPCTQALSKFKNYKNAYHENIDFHNDSYETSPFIETKIRLCSQGTIYFTCQKILDWQAIFFLYFEPWLLMFPTFVFEEC